jgi:SAM-dependent methyltransferase
MSPGKCFKNWVRLRTFASLESITDDDYKTTGSAFKAFEGSSTAVPSLVGSAHGIVLELGPGVGTQLDRFDKSKIEHVYGVELNPAFVTPLLAEVETAGLQGKYTVISGAVEDERLLAEYGIKAGSLDSIVCIGTLCSVSDPEHTMRWMYELLKPGGVFIFWEHRRSYNFLTRLVQGTTASAEFLFYGLRVLTC